jgi:serine/threonine-protein kinase
MVQLAAATGSLWEGVPEGDVVRIAQERGLVTLQEVERAKVLQDRHARRDDYTSLVDVLVGQKALTRSQALRLAQELKDASRVGSIPGYRFLAKLGEGSMGVVYKARQESLRRIVAVKILSRRLSRNKEFIARFQHEAQLGAQLASAHIPQIHDQGVSAGQHFLAMEYVEGVSVRHLLHSGKEFRELEALNVAVQAVEALAHLHAHDIVHRDVKPDNLVLTQEGVVKLMDLGLARSTQDRQRIELETGNAIGTPLYISPEQIHGRTDVDGRSDLYSLGASLYHMMTGTPPFFSDDSVEILQAHLKTRPTPPKSIRSRISDESNRMILRLLAKDPDKRFPSARELHAEMQRVRRLVRSALADAEANAGRARAFGT